MLALILILGSIATVQPATQESQNGLYKELLDPGLLIAPGMRTKFPAPTMPDGLDAAKQKAVILALIGMDQNYEDFTRKSDVAPYLLKLRDVKSADPKAPVKGVDSWFVVYGDLKATDDEKFLDRLIGKKGEGKGGDGKSQPLTAEDLAARKITVGAVEQKRERYGYIVFDILDHLRLKATGRSVWSKTGESLVIAAALDPRFVGDAKFPNEWQSLVKEDGKVKLGPAQPYSGAGFYLKITKLAEPSGALFVEQHIVFVEPHGWFNGENLLRSKLPQAVQINVRSIRREWSKNAAGGK